MRTFLLILLLTTLPVTESMAVPIDVYTGEAVVTGKDVKARKQALPYALQNVLQKMSGLRTFEDYPLVEPVLSQAPDILVSFYYQNIEAALADGSVSQELRLVAEFSANAVDEMSRTLGLPRWPVNREPIEIWVVVDDGLDRRILPVEFAYAWQSIAEVATRRGLPVDWPAPDDEGIYSVDAQLLWGGYTEDLGISPGKGVMIMAARREGTEWGVRSNLAYGVQSWTWRVQDIDLQAALIESLEQAVDQVAASKTIAASDQGAWMQELTVAGLRNADDYRRCLSYLQGLGVVTGVTVISAQPGSSSFRLQLSALPRYLEEALLGEQFLGFDENEQLYYLSQ
jgi:hypothetical protein